MQKRRDCRKKRELERTKKPLLSRRRQLLKLEKNLINLLLQIQYKNRDKRKEQMMMQTIQLIDL
jgi:hypothetical protein